MSATERDTGREIDLGVLTRQRAGGAPSVRRPRRWLRVAVPLVLVLAFLAVLGSSLEELVRGAREVRLVRPVPVAAGAVRRAPGEVVAQAAGWVEPDPFPVRATALAEGVVREMLVQESDAVEEGVPVALLVEDDARIALALAEARRERARGELQQAQAELRAANASFEAALEPTAAFASAEAELAGRRSAAEARAQALAKGRARLAVAEDELVVQRELEAAGAAGPRQVELAEARVEEARGELAELAAEAALALAGVKVAEAERERARRDLELRIEDRLRVEAAEAALARAEGGAAEAEAARDEAALRLERMVVRAPVAGLVLERLASVGTELSGVARAVATLYDPSSIRVRVDVPQQDLAALFTGQVARIESDARPGEPYAGRVIRIVRKADVQKVTVQAHVRVLDGDELLRPEMLVQVRFLAPEEARPASGESKIRAASAVAVPARLVLEGGRLWVLDVERGAAVLRSVRLGARDGERVLVEEGLTLSDKLIEPIDPGDAPLREGERVRAKSGEGGAAVSFIRLERVTRSYGRGPAAVTPLADVTLAIEEGEFFVLLGPSGSGKTTLLNLIAGIDRPDAGSVSVAGTDLGTLGAGALADWRAEHVGYVFQSANLVPVLTAYENVELPLWLHRASARERHLKVETALRAVGLAERAAHRPRALSGGQEQRVAIARAIVADPRVIVADEPTGNLDHESAESVLALLSRLHREHAKTIVMVTHDPRAAAHGTRRLFLDKGSLSELPPALAAAVGAGASPAAEVRP